MGRRHRLFPKASLVQVPPKGLCYHSKSVLLPCPPHRIAPLWERDCLPKAERTTKFNDQPSSTQLPLHPYRRTEPATLPWLKRSATNAVPLPYLKYQGSPKPSSRPCHPDPSVLSLPNPKLRERANVAVGTPSKSVKTPLHPKHKTETSIVLEGFPTILQSRQCQKEEPPPLKQKQQPFSFPEHRSKEWQHLKQQPPHLEFHSHHQAEELLQQRERLPSSLPILDYQLEATSLMDCKTRAMGEPSTFPDPEASARPAPESSRLSTEAAQNCKNQVRILTVMLGGGGTNLLPTYLILQSPCKDHNSKTDMALEKASDLDFLVNKASRHPDLAFGKMALPFISLNQQSGTWASPSSRPSYVSRSTSPEVPWPQFSSMFTNIASPDPTHQARVTMRQSQGFIPSTRAASDPSLFLATWETSGPFQCPEHAAEDSPGPDYKDKDTTGPLPPSGHNVKIPPPGVDHFNEVSPDLSHQATISMGPEQKTSPSVVLSSGPTAVSRSKAQVKTPLFPPISQIECLPCPRLLGMDSLMLEYKSQGRIGVDQQAEAPVDSDKQVTPSFCPEQQTWAIWGPDCQTLVIPSPSDHVQFLNSFDYQENEPLTPETKAKHELIGAHYQTQIVPGPHEIIPPQSDKTKTILNHDHTAEPESQATQPESTSKQAIPQLCPIYWMIPPQTIADHITETMPDTSAQVTPYQTEVDFRKTVPQYPEHQAITPPCQENTETSTLGIDHQIISPSGQNDSETPSMDKDHHFITPPEQDDSKTPSLGIEHQVVSPPGQDDSETSSMDIDHHFTTPPGQDDSETLSLGIDHQVITPPWQDGTETSSLGIDYQDITPPGKEDSETSSLGIDHQVITPSGQDDNNEIPSLGIDHQDMMPYAIIGQDDTEIPLLGIDHQVITPPGKEDTETSSLGIECQVISPPGKEDNKTSSLGTDCQVITPPGKENTETSSLGIECQVISPPGKEDTETSSLGIDHQVITPSGQDDNNEIPSLGIDHQDMMPYAIIGQDDTEIPLLGIDHQVITPPGKEDTETSSLGIDHQVITPPGKEDTETSSLSIEHQVISSPGKEDNKTSSLGIECQVISPPGKEDTETSFLNIDHQVITPPGKEDNKTSSLGIECQVISPPGKEDTETSSLNIDCQVITPPEKEDNKTSSLGTDRQVITPSGQDDNGEILSLGTDHQVITPPVQNNSETPSLGTEPQVVVPPGKDDSETPSLGISHWAITLPWQDDNSETPFLGVNHQVIIPPGQDENSEISSLGIDHQVTTPPCQDDDEIPSQGIATALPDSDHLTIVTPSPNLKLGALLEPSEPVTPLHDLNHEANMLVRPEYQNTTSFGHNNQVEIGSDATSHQSTLPAGKDDQVIPCPVPKKKTISLSTLSHQKDTQTSHVHHHDKASLTSYYRNKAQSGFQHQTGKNREIPWHLKYIKSYTIEGRDNISARTIRAIINSIPEEKIKRDIRKQILFRRMKESPHKRPGECMSVHYSVCLECASWVPNGCLHDKRMKRQFEAEVLAIPMPLPGSEDEMGLKFVLRVPYNPFSFFSQLFPQLNIQWPSYYVPYFPSFSHKHTVFRVPTTVKLLDYSEVDNYPCKIKTFKSHQSLTEENLSIFPRESIPIGKESNEKEKSKGHGKGFKSLLEKFQRQRQN